MKHTFKIRYEIDAPLAIAVAAYLDCEHYVFLHRLLTTSIEVIDSGPDFYRCRQTWKILGFTFGQTYSCRYEAPATFINSELSPHPYWLPSIHHLIRTNTVLRYFENPESRTTLSELTVEMEMPFWLYPLRLWFQRVVEEIKILKDLEDVAMLERRARLFGRNSNSVYLKPSQFLLHKAQYLKYFGKDSEFLGDPSSVQRHERWTNILDLDLPYVRRFLERDYFRYTNYSFTDPRSTAGRGR